MRPRRPSQPPKLPPGAPRSLRWRLRGQLIPLGKPARRRMRAARCACVLVALALSPLLLAIRLIHRRTASAIAMALLWPIVQHWEGSTRDGKVVASIDTLGRWWLRRDGTVAEPAARAIAA